MKARLWTLVACAALFACGDSPTPEREDDGEVALDTFHDSADISEAGPDDVDPVDTDADSASSDPRVADAAPAEAGSDSSAETGGLDISMDIDADDFGDAGRDTEVEVAPHPGPCHIDAVQRFWRHPDRRYSYTYNSRGEPLEERFDFEADGTVDRVRRFEYDDAGRMVREAIFTDRGTRVESDITYSYSEDGRSMTEEHDTDGDGERDRWFVYGYGPDGRISGFSESTPDGLVRSTAYDYFDGITRETQREDGRVVRTTTTLYDDEGHVIEVQYGDGWSTTAVVRFEYDGEGHLLSESSSGDRPVYRDSYVYGELGNVVEYTRDERSDGTIDIRVVYVLDGEFVTATRERYGGAGGSVSSRTVSVLTPDYEALRVENDIDADGRVDSIEVHSYDEAGNLLLTERDGDADGDVGPDVELVSERQARWEYTYNADGLIEREDKVGVDPDVVLVSTNLRYAPDGRLIREEVDLGVDAGPYVIRTFEYSDGLLNSVFWDRRADGSIDSRVDLRYDTDGLLASVAADTDLNGAPDWRLLYSYTADVIVHVDGGSIAELPGSASDYSRVLDPFRRGVGVASGFEDPDGVPDQRLVYVFDAERRTRTISLDRDNDGDFDEVLTVRYSAAGEVLTEVRDVDLDGNNEFEAVYDYGCWE